MRNVWSREQIIKYYSIHRVDNKTIIHMFMIHDGNELMAISFKMPEAITKHYKHPDVTQKNIHKMGSNIRHIKTPSKEFQMLAVKQDGFAIQYLINPSKELCVEALYQRCLSQMYWNW